ncbi:proenkephalin-A-like [Gouania willdenowi]|uniref:Proenkephalin-A-like n=1 Tax=Gouania willdenowi TaxID=441366 RepID=A0A8C5DIK5_GOUWI|nr:proenkephalin-A-like [Gouania willdenowi]
MKIPLWCVLVLLACVCVPAHTDCQRECVTCSHILQQQHFNTMVCLLECEAEISSSLTWELCRRAVKLSNSPAVSKRRAEELEVASLDLSSASELLRSAAAQRFQDADPDETTFEPRSLQYDDSSLLESSEEDGEAFKLLGEDRDQREDREQRDAEAEGPGADEGPHSSEGATLSKRFGGFQRGRHSYRKLISSPIRPLQKRYGGFIGVRKSARKWNSQKRVNQLLRQYLGMRSSRSGRISTGPVSRVWRQNQL